LTALGNMKALAEKPMASGPGLAFDVPVRQNI
jgi:hypothetical protein